jgi:hypothetical protein
MRPNRENISFSLRYKPGVKYTAQCKNTQHLGVISQNTQHYGVISDEYTIKYIKYTGRSVFHPV